MSAKWATLLFFTLYAKKNHNWQNSHKNSVSWVLKQLPWTSAQHLNWNIVLTDSVIPEMQDSPLPHGLLFIRQIKSKTDFIAVVRNSSSSQWLTGGAGTKEEHGKEITPGHKLDLTDQEWKWVKRKTNIVQKSGCFVLWGLWVYLWLQTVKLRVFSIADSALF